MYNSHVSSKLPSASIVDPVVVAFLRLERLWWAVSYRCSSSYLFSRPDCDPLTSLHSLPITCEDVWKLWADVHHVLCMAKMSRKRAVYAEIRRAETVVMEGFLFPLTQTMWCFCDGRFPSAGVSTVVCHHLLARMSSWTISFYRDNWSLSRVPDEALSYLAGDSIYEVHYSISAV